MSDNYSLYAIYNLVDMNINIQARNDFISFCFIVGFYIYYHYMFVIVLLLTFLHTSIIYAPTNHIDPTPNPHSIQL